jgi:hypothetical protein
MTVTEATAVAGQPLTGESWHANPVAIGAPAAAGTTWDQYAQWFEVGAHDGKTILAVYDFMQGVTLIEEAADGSLTWIANPFPADTAGPAQWNVNGMAKDAVQCYESLAVPTSVALPDGAVATVSSATNAVLPTSTADSEESVGHVGGAQLFRLVDSYPIPGLVSAGHTLPPFKGVAYALKTPFGGWLQLEFNPLEGATAMTGATSLADYFDTRCGDDPRYQSLIPATAAADWQVVGALSGRDVAIATASNPFATERYDAYVNHFAQIGDNQTVPVDFATFLAAPGLVALRADEGGWWVQINTDVSPRAWC